MFRPASGAWFLHHSSDGTEEVFTFGNPTDIPQVGDFNGDGIDDPAVYRGGNWFTEPGINPIWGIPTDIPLALPHAIRRAAGY